MIDLIVATCIIELSWVTTHKFTICYIIYNIV